MKRFLSVLLLVFCAVSIKAQDIQTLLSLSGDNRISLDFSYRMKGSVPLSGDGNLVVEGDCFRLDSGALKVYCDGRTKWTLDEESEEVYIEDGEGALAEILGASSDYLELVVDITAQKGEISGTVKSPQDGSDVDFKLSDIKVSPKGKDLSLFVLDVKGLDKSYVITDLR